MVWKPTAGGGSAQTILVDSFEDGDLSEYGGNTGNAASVVQDSTEARDGSYYAILGSGSFNNQFMSLPGDGLPEYPQHDDEIHAWVKPGGNGAIFGYFVQERSSNSVFGVDSYFVQIIADRDNIKHYVVESGSNTDIYSNNSVSGGVGRQWYEIIVTPASDNTHAVEVRDAGGSTVDSWSVTDNTHTSGGIMWGSNNTDTGGACSFDYCYVNR
jgi:hypothetical protein